MFALPVSLTHCLSTAGPRPGTGPPHQLYRTARGYPGICQFSFLSDVRELMFYSGNTVRGKKKIFRECVEKLRSKCWTEETTICYKISLVRWLITSLNVIWYLSTCHTVYISELILCMIMPQVIINTYASLMYELKNGKVFTSKFVGTGPSSNKKRIYRAAVSQRLRNAAIERRGLF